MNQFAKKKERNFFMTFNWLQLFTGGLTTKKNLLARWWLILLLQPYTIQHTHNNNTYTRTIDHFGFISTLEKVRSKRFIFETFYTARYMKCLAIGMNPNYVLSEDERKKRFRKKNSTVETESTLPPGKHHILYINILWINFRSFILNCLEFSIKY